MASELSLKLLIDTKSSRVLFAEADKDVVDFLFGLLSIPVGAITKLLANDQMAGSIGCIYKSIQDMDTTHFQSNGTKNTLLNPTTRSPSGNGTLFLIGAGCAATKYYRCACSFLWITDVYGTRCPSCGTAMYAEVHFVDTNSKEARSAPCLAKRTVQILPPVGSSHSSTYASAYGTAIPPLMHCFTQPPQQFVQLFGPAFAPHSRSFTPHSQPLILQQSTNAAKVSEVPNNHKVEVGFVKDVVYTVMDDLTVTPLSAISSITMLNKLNVTDVGSLEERTVKLGKQEGLALLKSSLHSNTVLTDVFIRKHTAKRRAQAL